MEFVAFILFSVPIVWLSWRSLFSVRRHGLYRFIGWECILWLLINDFSYWFINPFGITQFVSWILLLYSLGLLVSGGILMKRIGKADSNRKDDSLYNFEKTTKLIQTGIFKYVRHPLYGSLIFLTWGIFLKKLDLLLFIFSLISTIFLILTAVIEEKEDIKYFGNGYLEYMKRTKMFVPFLL